MHRLACGSGRPPKERLHLRLAAIVLVGCCQGSGAATANARVTVRGDQFLLRGRAWRPVGRDYPEDRYPTGSDWLSPGKYNPAVVERDLHALARSGVNVVNVRYVDAEQAAQ